MPGQLLAVPYTAVQFVALQQCRSFANRNGLLIGDSAWLLSFLSGATAGAAATVASYPFDTLRTILAAQGKPPVGLLLCLGRHYYLNAVVLQVFALPIGYASAGKCAGEFQLLMKQRAEGI